MRTVLALVTCSLIGSAAFADADRPRLEDVVANAPEWARDCTLDLVTASPDLFSVAVMCRGSEELMFERREMSARAFEAHAKHDADELGATRTKLTVQTAIGAATGFASVRDASDPSGRETHVIVRRAAPRGPSDVYYCSSVSGGDQLARCKVLVEVFGRSTVIRRGVAAFPRPKS